MTVHRRDVLRGLGFAAAAAFRDVRLHADASLDFPRKSDFLIDPDYTYLNAAYTHPIPKVSIDAARPNPSKSVPPPVAAQSKKGVAVP